MFRVYSFRSTAVQGLSDAELKSAIASCARSRSRVTDKSMSDDDVKELVAYIRQFGSNSSAQAAETPNVSAAAAVAAVEEPVDLTEGQTPQEVEKMLGKPDDVTRIKETLVYAYPTVKVFFENGKLVNVEERNKR